MNSRQTICKQSLFSSRRRFLPHPAVKPTITTTTTTTTLLACQILCSCALCIDGYCEWFKREDPSEHSHTFMVSLAACPKGFSVSPSLSWLAGWGLRVRLQRRVNAQSRGGRTIMSTFAKRRRRRRQQQKQQHQHANTEHLMQICVYTDTHKRVQQLINGLAQEQALARQSVEISIIS